MEPKFIKSLFVLLFLSLFSCRENDESKIIGNWKVIEYSEVNNGSKSPQSQEFCHYSFSEDTLRIYCLNNKSQLDTTVYWYSLRNDSIFLCENPDEEEFPSWKYSFNNDTLILEQSYYDDNWSSSKSHKLIRFVNEPLTKFNEHDGIKGDWKHHRTYLAHKDSIRTNKKGNFWFTSDLIISESSFSYLFYPCFYEDEYSYYRSNDSIIVSLEKKKERLKYDLNDDTLKFYSKYNERQDYIICQEFTKAYFDNGIITYLENNILDPDCFQNNWWCHPTEEQEKVLSNHGYLKEFPLKIEFPFYDGWHDDKSRTHRVSFTKDIINIEIDTAVYKMRVKNFFIDKMYHRKSHIFVNPIIEGKEIEMNLWFEED
ncbi:hypothetical protein K6119_04065 [Paracrocinitomix mangrovi]|uniref:hypothetical protein n=1 Tax=Paracrocinitomix mangrovi TaxID=2862509 RepID=UPI001C8ED4B8|nr:hypothetical protein [Paracrocinitomix mangrovi]UKN02688.1 hypothetical protein K6119_04065 [Paracrocinitomix mangrovi]